MRRLLIGSGLLFPDRREEASFLRDFALTDMPQTRAAMLLGCCVYYIFAAWDWVLDPVAWQVTYKIRLVVVILVLLPLTALTFVRRVRPRLEWVLLLYSAVPAAVLPVIYSYLKDGFSHGAAGVVIVILFVSTLLTMRSMFFAAFCVVIWGSFATVEILSAQSNIGQLFVNQLYCGTAVILALYSAYFRERLARRQYRTSAALQVSKDVADGALADLQVARRNLVQSEKLAALGQLVSGLAHELNTPIGNAVTTSTSIEEDVRTLARTVETGRIAKSELTRLVGHLTEGTGLLLRSLSRTVDLVGAFKQLASDRGEEDRRTFTAGPWLVDHAKGFEDRFAGPGGALRVACPADLELHADPRRLERLLANLLENALVHAFPPARPGLVTISLEAAGETGIRILVADNGQGIPPEHQGKIFDPFFTTRRGQGGSGLGLHVVHNIVAGMDGRVAVESSAGAGTRFVIDLPAVRAKGGGRVSPIV